MRRVGHPHAIDDGSGEHRTVLRRVPGVLGERVEGENVVTPRFADTPEPVRR